LRQNRTKFDKDEDQKVFRTLPPNFVKDFNKSWYKLIHFAWTKVNEMKPNYAQKYPFPISHAN